MTRAITIVALACLFVAGIAATSILGRDSVPLARFALASDPAVTGPVSNKEGKKDRLAFAAMALASFEPPQTQIQTPVQAQAQAQAQSALAKVQAPAALSEPMRQAYASTAPADVWPPTPAAPAAAPMLPSAPLATSAKPKIVSKPPPQQPQKNYALLSDIQIAGIKERLKLSSAQESYWPPVENALRAVARKIHAGRQTNPNATGVPIDPDAEEVQQLKSAAMPLLFQLREDQKSEVRSLARIIGLEKVASMI